MNFYSQYKNPKINDAIFLHVMLNRVQQISHYDKAYMLTEFRINPDIPDFGSKTIHSVLAYTLLEEITPQGGVYLKYSISLSPAHWLEIFQCIIAAPVSILRSFSIVFYSPT